MPVRRVIVLKGTPCVVEDHAASEAITPGHLLELESGGTVRKQTDDAANVAMWVALNRDEMGAEVEDAYASGDTVKIALLHAGHRFYAFIPSGQNIAKGAYLTTNATGCLTGASASATVRRAMALEAVNNSAGPGDARIAVEVV